MKFIAIIRTKDSIELKAFYAEDRKAAYEQLGRFGEGMLLTEDEMQTLMSNYNQTRCGMDMNIQEAKKIANMCERTANPPTNPAVLLRAMRSIYLEQGTCPEMIQVLRWLIALEREGLRKQYGDNWIEKCI